MAKKANGEGTVYFNGRYWVGQVTVGRHPSSGKLRRKSVYGKTKKEALRKKTELEYGLQTGININPSAMTVQSWTEYWLENFKKPIVSGAAYVKIESLARNHIIKLLGHIALKDLNVFHIQEALNTLPQKGLSDAFIKKVYTYINSILKYAAKTELIKKNPCENAVAPKTGRKKKVNALTKAEQAALVSVCQGKRNGGLFIFLTGTGLRIGEALAMTWDCVNFEKKILRVCKTAVEINGKSKIAERTKTTSGDRVVRISGTVLCLLQEIKVSQDKEKNTMNLVFPSQNYTICLSSNIRVRLARYCVLAGIRRVSIHELRHTFATRALEQGVNVKVLSKTLGHSDIKVTLNTYSHVLQEFEQENMDSFDVFLH